MTAQAHAAEVAASWKIFGAEPAPAVGVKHLDWVSALGRAVRSGDLDPETAGYALAFTNGGFDYSTGRQTQARSPGFLAQAGGASVSTWKRQLSALSTGRWLTKYGEVSQGPRPTPLYLLSIPMGH